MLTIVELATHLNSAAIRVLRRIGRDDGKDGVTGARLSALSVLVFGAAETVGDLARREGVSAPTMTRIVDGLVRDGLARRTPSPTDGRVVRLLATTKGKRLMERGRARRVRHLSDELRALNERDRRTLDRAVRILERLGKQASSGGNES